MRRTSRRPAHALGSGNVFRDLRVPRAEEDLAKSSLLFEIAQALERRGLNQTEAARLLGIPQPQVSNLLRGRTAGFSVQRLTTLLTRLGKGVTIVISDIPHQAGLPRLPVVRDAAGAVSRMAANFFAASRPRGTGSSGRPLTRRGAASPPASTAARRAARTGHAPTPAAGTSPARRPSRRGRSRRARS